MNLHARIIDDMKFCLANPEEFESRGRFSLTVAMRTVVALNEEVTAAEFVAAMEDMGYNGSTARKQYRLSRAIDEEYNA